MSHEIFPQEGDPVEDHSGHQPGAGKMLVTAFWGGAARGCCLQFTPEMGERFCQLNRAEVVALHARITAWLKDPTE